MALSDWFRKKQGEPQGPKVIGVTKGGSRQISYENTGPAEPKFGCLPESTLEQLTERERIYRDIFGECDTVSHELLPRVPHIDVYRFPPNNDRDFYTFITGGMSDLPMNSPQEFGRDARRIELVFYAAEDLEVYVGWLRFLAHFAHDNNTWLHFGHTMPNGMPPEPLFEEGPLDTTLFCPSIVVPDAQLGERLFIQGDPVNLVWCVPITRAECEFKLERGVDALYDVFNEKDHPFVYTGQRASYV